MSNENKTTTISKKDLTQLIQATVTFTMESQQAPRIQALKETSLLHYLNLSGKSKEFLRATADLGLAIVDAGLGIPTALLTSEIVLPSLNCDSIEKWLWPDDPKCQTVVEDKQ